MKVQLRNNVFTATQWFKDGDHPGEVLDRRTGIRTITHLHSYVETRNITPGQWIVEMFDGLHLMSDEKYWRLFTSADVRIEIPKHLYDTSPSLGGDIRCFYCDGTCHIFACGAKEYCGGDPDKRKANLARDDAKPTADCKARTE